MRSPFLAVLEDLAGALTGANWPWYLFGGQAALLYGCHRLTLDVDVTVLPRARTLQSLIDALEQGGIALRTGRDFVEEHRLAPCVHRETGITVDVALGSPGLEELFLERAVLHTVSGIDLVACAPADLMVMKLLAGRGKDLEDARTLLQILGGDLDRAWVSDTLRAVDAALGRAEFLPVWSGLLDGWG